MTSDKHENSNIQLIEDIDRTIHAPTRLKILVCLAVVEHADFTFLLHQTGLTRGNLSPNLRKLEAANYVDIKKEFVDNFPRTLISLTDKGRASIQAYRERMLLVVDELLGQPNNQ